MTSLNTNNHFLFFLVQKRQWGLRINLNTVKWKNYILLLQEKWSYSLSPLLALKILKQIIPYRGMICLLTSNTKTTYYSQ